MAGEYFFVRIPAAQIQTRQSGLPGAGSLPSVRLGSGGGGGGAEGVARFALGLAEQVQAGRQKKQAAVDAAELAEQEARAAASDRVHLAMFDKQGSELHLNIISGINHGGVLPGKAAADYDESAEKMIESARPLLTEESLAMLKVKLYGYSETVRRTAREFLYKKEEDSAAATADYLVTAAKSWAHHNGKNWRDEYSINHLQLDDGEVMGQALRGVVRVGNELGDNLRALMPLVPSLNREGIFETVEGLQVDAISALVWEEVSDQLEEFRAGGGNVDDYKIRMEGFMAEFANVLRDSGFSDNVVVQVFDRANKAWNIENGRLAAMEKRQEHVAQEKWEETQSKGRNYLSMMSAPTLLDELNIEGVAVGEGNVYEIGQIVKELRDSPKSLKADKTMATEIMAGLGVRLFLQGAMDSHGLGIDAAIRQARSLGKEGFRVSVSATLEGQQLGEFRQAELSWEALGRVESARQEYLRDNPMRAAVDNKNIPQAVREMAEDLNETGGWWRGYVAGADGKSAPLSIAQAGDSTVGLFISRLDNHIEVLEGMDRAGMGGAAAAIDDRAAAAIMDFMTNKNGASTGGKVDFLNKLADLPRQHWGALDEEMTTALLAMRINRTLGGRAGARQIVRGLNEDTPRMLTPKEIREGVSTRLLGVNLQREFAAGVSYDPRLWGGEEYLPPTERGHKEHNKRVARGFVSESFDEAAPIAALDSGGRAIIPPGVFGDDVDLERVDDVMMEGVLNGQVEIQELNKISGKWTPMDMERTTDFGDTPKVAYDQRWRNMLKGPVNGEWTMSLKLIEITGDGARWQAFMVHDRAGLNSTYLEEDVIDGKKYFIRLGADEL